MCGRYTLAAGASELVEVFDVPVPDFDFAARYNIAPGQQAPVVAEDLHGRRIGLLTWGLVPSWASEPGRPLINARSETVAERPSFRDAFSRHRCLVPADGFYEWRPEGGRKAPYWIHPESGELLSFAGVWDTWSRPGAEPRHGFAILTMPSTGNVARIHDRMPVVIGEGDRDRWLSRDTDLSGALELLRRPGQPIYECRAVSTRVNRPDEDDPGLIEGTAG